MILLDDHLLRDLVAEELSAELDDDEGFATTNLWLSRLAGALTHDGPGGALSGVLRSLGDEAVARFRRELTERIDEVTIVPMRDLVWSMAELQQLHRNSARMLSTAMVEALAAAHHLDASIAVAHRDVGPGLQAAAGADNVGFRVISR